MAGGQRKNIKFLQSIYPKCLFELDNKGLRRDEKDTIIQNK